MSEKRSPEFRTPQEESDAWDKTDSLEWAGEEVAVRFRPRPKGMISIRLDKELLDGIRAVARGRHTGYQTLMRQWLWERLEQEQAVHAPAQRRPA